MPSRPTPFLLLTKSRSGSKWLVELLDSHEQVAVFGELFGGPEVRSDYGAQGFQRFDDYLARRRDRRVLPLAWHRLSCLGKLHAARPEARAVGVKLVYGHALTGVFEYLAIRRARVLHLFRANLLDAALSWELARARGFRGGRRGEPLPAARARLDPVTLRDRLEQHELQIASARSRIRHYRLPALEVCYEELVARGDETLERILRFLGVEPAIASLRSTFVSVDSAREDALENLAEVREALSGTRFEWMLDTRCEQERPE